ncbi:MAG: alkylphosphonate utilization protein [Myxococcales bacterium]|nr:alkylphosphonate utilization protein [Myxococcales bacterium]
MTEPNACPVCTMTDLLEAPDHFECATCGHEWPRAREVKDANGNLLADGDTVTLIKALKLKGGSGSLKVGTKVKNIRIVDGDHELDCKIDGVGIMLKAEFVKKA